MNKKLNIAIDFDNTYTADPELMDLFITSALARGHKCFIVSMRSSNEKKLIEQQLITKVPVICCNHTFKRKVCSQRGIYISVWIDDTPAGIDDSRMMLAYDEEGRPQTIWEWLDKPVAPEEL